MTINTKCADSAIWGADQDRIADNASDRKKLGLSIYGGCCNNWAMRGGTQLSMHAFACAIDFDRPQLVEVGRDKVRLAQKDCEAL